MSAERKPVSAGAELIPLPDRHADVARPAAVADTDSWVHVVTQVVTLAETIADTDFVPAGLRGNVPATTAAMLYGREVGLPPMTALSQTHVVKGKPGISAEAMRAMIFAAGHELEVTESTGATCTVRGRRKGSAAAWTTVTWNLDMARSAGLLPGKPDSNWRTYPRAMLQARATAELARLVFPDVIHGFVAVEELNDSGEASGTSSGTTVRRRGAAAAPNRNPRKEPAPPPAAPEPLDGPPLPGEPETDRTGAAGDARQNGRGDGTAEAGGSPAAPPGRPPYDPPDDEGPEYATKPQLSMLFASLNGYGIGDSERHRYASRILAREVPTFKSLTKADVSTIIDTLAMARGREALDRLLDIREMTTDAPADEPPDDGSES